MLIRNTLIFICSTSKQGIGNGNRNGTDIFTSLVSLVKHLMNSKQHPKNNNNNMIIKFSNILIGCISDNIIREFYRVLVSIVNRKSARLFRNERTNQKKKRQKKIYMCEDDGEHEGGISTTKNKIFELARTPHSESFKWTVSIVRCKEI